MLSVSRFRESLADHPAILAACGSAMLMSRLNWLLLRVADIWCSLSEQVLPATNLRDFPTSSL